MNAALRAFQRQSRLRFARNQNHRSPEYASGTSTFEGAASRIIEPLYGDTGLDFCFQTDLALRPRCFSSAFQGAVESGFFENGGSELRS